MWVKPTPTAAPLKAQVVATGSNDTFAVVFPGQEKIELLPSNQMFLRESTVVLELDGPSLADSDLDGTSGLQTHLLPT